MLTRDQAYPRTRILVEQLRSYKLLLNVIRRTCVTAKSLPAFQTRSTEEALDAVVQSPDTEQSKSHKDGDGGDKAAVKRKARTENTTRKRAYKRENFNLF